MLNIKHLREKFGMPNKATEVLDSTPIAVPLKFRAAPTQSDLIRQAVHEAFQRVAGPQQLEEFGDTMDFDDDYDPDMPMPTPYEHAGTLVDDLRRFAEEELVSEGSQPAAPPPIAGGGEAEPTAS